MLTGLLQFEYKGRAMKITFSLQPSGYGGLPLLIIEDKNHRSYPFVRGTNDGWYSLAKEPRWPRDFLDMLYYAMEVKYHEISS